ncbi:Phosphatidylserine/phosphatidylglycerophosphate/cardiolipin synthase [Gemmobacter aquatilis]|uniref:Phospholipase D n=1 Tax=Gemmobacter aquatilis TaxID=933059 RepID=A0A1H7Y9E7_9RHOB|nr:phospholipase D family protein [Gemmobacter aquatilis]SEM42846.1 Phosphatidylserine/phosphatidylglycerophosphate/cardiolipin synthase [Gemmobacter aquatilis]
MLWAALGLLALLLAAVWWVRRGIARLAAAALPDAPAPHQHDSPLRRAVAALALPPGQSGLVTLRDGLDAYAARVQLIRAATCTLDLQYYIWQGDTAGRLMLDELRQAAARGVRIRLLLDDLGVPDLDPLLQALDSLPGVEVRLFNPFLLRRLRLLNLLLDFGRLNRRMHNKSFTADGVASVLGGRNIGDEYFESGARVHYIDFDLLALGPAPAAVTADFDRYWASGHALPAAALLRPRPGALGRLQAKAAALRTGPEGAPYAEALTEGSALGDLLAGRLVPHVAPVQLLSDDPEKARGRASQHQLIIARLALRVARARQKVDLVSAYFIPGGRGLRTLSALTRRGVQLRILTNGQQSTDVRLVHVFYARYRRKLLRAGVAVYEVKAGLGLRLPRRRKRRVLTGASTGTSLHAKTFVIDGRSLFVGSFNLDQRSVFLNTEMGFLIESPALAAEVSAGIEEDMAEIAYRLRLRKGGQKGALDWIETDATGALIIHRTEPGTTLFSRTVLRLAGRLPIEWLL